MSRRIWYLDLDSSEVSPQTSFRVKTEDLYNVRCSLFDLRLRQYAERSKRRKTCLGHSDCVNRPGAVLLKSSIALASISHP